MRLADPGHKFPFKLLSQKKRKTYQHCGTLVRKKFSQTVTITVAKNFWRDEKTTGIDDAFRRTATLALAPGV